MAMNVSVTGDKTRRTTFIYFLVLTVGLENGSKGPTRVENIIVRLNQSVEITSQVFALPAELVYFTAKDCRICFKTLYCFTVTSKHEIW